MRTSVKSSSNNSATINGRGMSRMTQQNKATRNGVEEKSSKNGRQKTYKKHKVDEERRNGHSSMFGAMDRESGMSSPVEFAKALNKENGADHLKNKSRDVWKEEEISEKRAEKNKERKKPTIHASRSGLKRSDPSSKTKSSKNTSVRTVPKRKNKK